ncbi:MAG: nitroreductase family protein [Candidatus Sumerlaeaceae bacterium]
MDALQAIKTRRSIRVFERREVPREVLRELVAAGMQAPSAGNQQPWQFVVVDDPELIQRVPEFHPYAQMADTAPAAILVCGDLSLEQRKGYWVQDCAAATQNILLAAHALGLGAVWTGVYPREERVGGARKLFGIPDTVIPLALIFVGYPAERPAPENRFCEERIHWNRW